MNRYETAEIKRRVSMPELLRYYGFTDGEKRRIRCPIHNGKDRNFSFNDKVFFCFVCKAKGTVIDFVMQYFGLDFEYACQKINGDFNLGINLRLPVETKLLHVAPLKNKKQYIENSAKIETRKLRIERTERRYYAALDRWVRLDTMCRENAPAGITEPIRDDYVYALRHIDAADWELQQAQNDLFDLY